MSLYGAMNIGVASLAANSAALSVTSSNIANVNTVGYKNATSMFSTFLSSVDGGGGSAGVQMRVGQSITTQGLPTNTGSATDLSITGNGFFVVASNPSATASQMYTRAGNFIPDDSGNLVNAAGHYLLGYKLDSNGNVPSDTSDLSLVNVSSLAGTAEGSTTLSLKANLQASSAVATGYTAGDITSGAVTPEFQRTINVYDSQGGSQPVSLAFVKTGANAWAYEASYAGDVTKITGSNPIGQGTVTFNTDGTLANVDGAAPASANFTLNIPWSAASGLAAQSVDINLGSVNGAAGLTQYDTPSVLNGITTNGSAFGSVTGVTITEDGTLTAQFSNGLSWDVYKIPLATFTNPNGLGQISGNAYYATKGSGTPSVNLANSGAAGKIQSETLEASTVDLANEFTNLITTQRAYSASARIITTADEMLRQLDVLGR
jgi:flagellar hook protein FlgE